MIVLGRALHLSPPSRNAIEGIRMPDSVSFKVCPIFWKSFQFLSSSWRKGMRNCGWAGVFLCAISGYLFKIAGRVVSSASTAPVPSADWPTRSLCRLASFCTASSPASCALCRKRRWRRQGCVRMFIFAGHPIGGSHGFLGWEPMGGHGVTCSPGTPSGFPARLPDASKSFLVS